MAKNWQADKTLHQTLPFAVIGWRIFAIGKNWVKFVKIFVQLFWNKCAKKSDKNCHFLDFLNDIKIFAKLFWGVFAKLFEKIENLVKN